MEGKISLKQISLKEASALTGYAPDYIGWLIRSGRIEGDMLPKNTFWVVARKDIIDYCNKNKKTEILHSDFSPKYLSLREASKLTGYAPDYIGQLIRKGRVRGEKRYAKKSWVTALNYVDNYITRKKRKKYFNFCSLKIPRNIFSVAVFVFIIFSGFITWAFASKNQTQTADIYSTQTEESSGWENPRNAIGIPQVQYNGDINLFSEENSATYKGGPSFLVAGGFLKTSSDAFFEDAEKENFEQQENNLTENENNEGAATTTDAADTIIIDIASSSQDAASTDQTIILPDLAPQDSGGATTNQESQPTSLIKKLQASLNENILSSLRPEAKKLFGIGTAEAQDVLKFNELLEKEFISARIKLSLAMGEKSQDIIIDRIIREQKINNSSSEDAIEAPTGLWQKIRNIFGFFAQKISQIRKKIVLSSARAEDEILTGDIYGVTDFEQAATTATVIIDDIQEESLEQEGTTSDILMVENIMLEETSTEIISSETSTKENIADDINENIPAIAEDEAISNVTSSEIMPDADDKIIIYYSFDGSQWNVADKISSNNLSNAKNGGYFSFDAPFLESWEDIKNLKIKIEGVVGGEIQFTTFLDSVWVEAEYKEIQEEEGYDLIPLKEGWRADETPEFEIVSRSGERESEQNIAQKIIGRVASAVSEKPKVRTKLVNPGWQQIELSDGDGFVLDSGVTDKIKITEQEDFTPGLHKISVEYEKNGKVYNLETEFTWGVLAVNINKSIYLSGEQAYLQMAALSDDGNTICDANLKLEITAPDGKKSVFATEQIEEPLEEETAEEPVLPEATSTDEELPAEKIPAESESVLEISTTSEELYLPLIEETASGSEIVQESSTSSEEVILISEETSTSTQEEIPSESPEPENTADQAEQNETPTEPDEDSPVSFFDKIKKLLPIGSVAVAADEGLPAGVIQLSRECGPNNVTDKPDYFAYYQTGETGVYRIKLTNLDTGHVIEDSFEVRDSAPFEVERTGPTRIWPFADYEMTIKIKANRDFEGQIIERIPESFAIINRGGGTTDNIRIENSGREKTLTWADVALKEGEEIELNYMFDAPNTSPYIFLFGPLSFEREQNIVDKLKAVLGAEDSPSATLRTTVFQEIRSWQIASDAVTNTGIAAYGDGSAGVPKFRTYTENLFATSSAEITGPSSNGTAIDFMRIISSPTRDEKMIAHQKQGGRMDVVKCSAVGAGDTTSCDDMTGGAEDYANQWAQNVIGVTDCDFSSRWCGRAYDIAYEQLSGRAMVVFATGTTVGNTIYYKLYDGSSWSATGSLSMAGLNGTTTWVSLAARGDRLTGTRTNQILLVVANAPDQATSSASITDKVFTAIWDGTSWTNATTMTQAQGCSHAKCADGAWEEVSGNALVAYSEGIAGQWTYKKFDVNAGWDNATSLGTNTGNYITWVKMVSSPISDRIAIGINDAGSDFHPYIWKANGSSVGLTTATANASLESYRGQNGLAWERFNNEAVSLTSYTGSVFAGRYSTSTCTSLGCNHSALITLSPVPVPAADDYSGPTLAVGSPNSNKTMFLLADILEDLYIYRHDADTQLWTIPGGQTENALSMTAIASAQSTPELVFDFAYTPYSPWGLNWRWSGDVTNDTPATWLADQNATPTVPASGQTVRLRMNFAELGGMAQTNARKRLQYTTSSAPNATSTVWSDVGEQASTTAWKYADCSAGADDGQIASTTLASSTYAGDFIENGDSAITITHTALGIIENDYCIQSENAEVRDYYFRAFDNDQQSPVFRQQTSWPATPCYNSSACVYPGLTTSYVAPPDVVVSTIGSQTASIYIPNANNYVGGAFVITDNTTTLNVTGITITEQGTVDAATNLANIKLYYENDTSDPYTCSGESYSGLETQFGATTTFNGSNKASFSGSVAIATDSAMCVYVVLDVGAGASNGQTLEIEITNPSTEVTLSGGVVAGPATARQIADTTNLFTPYVTGSLGKTTDGWAGAIPVYMNLYGVSSSTYPYARASTTNPIGLKFYTPMSWNEGAGRFEGTIYPGSNYCNGCADPSTSSIGSFSVDVQLDNDAGFSSVDYSTSSGTFSTFETRRKSSPGEAADYTDWNPVWSTDHWNYTINDFTMYKHSGSGSNVAVAVPFHPTTANISNIAVTFGGVSVNQGTAASTTNCWWWDSASHTLYVQHASLTTTYVLVDITFESDTDLFATRYDRVQTQDMGNRLFWNGLVIANRYYSAFIYGGQTGNSGNNSEAVGNQAESHAHEPGGSDVSTDCMERVAVHVDDVVVNDGAGYYNWDIKWNKTEWEDYIASESNSQIVVVQRSDNTSSTGWGQLNNNGIYALRTQTYYSGERYIKNSYDFTNNGSSTHEYPLVWEREQWLGSDQETNDKARFYGSTTDVVMESRYPMSALACPAMTAYDSAVFVAMGVVFQQENPADYGIFAVEPFLQNTTAPEWPVAITNPHGTQTNDQTGFEYTFASVAPAETVNFTFWQTHYDTTSAAGAVSAMEEDCRNLNRKYTQNDWKWYDNADSVQPGSAKTASENTAITGVNSGDVLRLRMNLVVGNWELPTSTDRFKLQYASGTDCTAIASSSWYDVGATSSDSIWRGYNNSPADGTNTTSALLASSTAAQSYEENNPSSYNPMIAAVNGGGEWDWVIENNTSTANTSFCFRMVRSSGDTLDTYNSDSYPKLTTSAGGGPSGITISGTVYTDEGTTTMGASRLVRAKINGAGDYSTNTLANGTYSISATVSAAGNTITLYLDAATTSEKANLITIASSTTENITGLDLYQNRIIVTHPTSIPLNIVNLAQYDSTDDPDILFTATSSTGQITASSTSEFFVWPGKTFNNWGTNGAAGTTTFLDLDIRGALVSSSTQPIVISQNWFASSTQAAFTSASSTVTFTSATTTTIIKTNGFPFWNITFNNASGTWTFLDAATTTNDLIINRGTAASQYDMKVYGGDVTGNGGILNWSSSTFMVDGTGNFGGTSTWTFWNLTFGNGSAAQTTTATGTTTVIISNYLTIALSQTLNAGFKTWEIRGASTSTSPYTPFNTQGTFIASSSTFRYTAQQNTNVTAATYYNLTLQPTPPAFNYIEPVELKPSLTGQWVDMDVSSYVPEGASGVILHVNIEDAGTAIAFNVRKNGSTDSSTGSWYVSGNDQHQWGMIGVDTNRIFEAYAESTTTLTLLLTGYTMSSGVTFFTNAYDLSFGAASTSAWWDIDLTPYSSATPTGAIFAIGGGGGGTYEGMRKNGSTDNRVHGMTYSGWNYVGCDSSGKIEAYTNSADIGFYLIGVITDGAIFHTNAVNISLADAAVGSWTDINASSSATSSNGLFIHIYGGAGGYPGYAYGLRKNGSSENIVSDDIYHAYGVVQTDANTTIEGYVGDNRQDFYLLGFSEGANRYSYVLGTTTGQTLTVSNNLLVGDGINPLTVTATSNNPVIDVNNDVTISAYSTLAASTSNFTVARNWTNSGTFAAGSSTVTFDATTTGITGKTISGNLNSTSSFYKIAFNGTNNSWTITDPIKISSRNAVDTFLLKQGKVTLGDGNGDDLEVLGSMIVGDGSGYATFTTAALNNASGTITININASSSPSNCANCIVQVGAASNATSTFWLRKNATLKFNSYSSDQSGLQVNSMGYLWVEGEQAATNTVLSVQEDTASTTISVSGTPFTGLNFAGMQLRIMSAASNTTAFGKIYDIATNTANTIKISATSSLSSYQINSLSTTTYGVATICLDSSSIISADNQQVGRYLHDTMGTQGYFKIIQSSDAACASSRDQFRVIAEPDSNILSALALWDEVTITDFINTNDQFEIFDYAQITAHATNHGYILAQPGSETLIKYADISELGGSSAGVLFDTINGANSNEGMTVEKSRIRDGGNIGVNLTGCSNNTGGKGFYNNAFFRNGSDNIALSGSQNNTLNQNSSFGSISGDCFYLTDADSNSFTGNYCYERNGNNGFNIYGDSNNNTFASNTSYANPSGFTIAGSYDNIFTQNTSFGNSADGFTVSADSNSFTSNISYANADGFYLTAGSNNTLTSNTSYANSQDGIDLDAASNSNTLNSNICYGNTADGFVIQGGSSNNTFTSNSSYLNNSDGFYIYNDSDYNTFISNSSYNNEEDGFSINYAYYNTFTSNDTYNNIANGFGLYNYSVNNTFNSNNSYGNNAGLLTFVTAGTILVNENYGTNTAADIYFNDSGPGATDYSTIRCYGCTLASATPVDFNGVANNAYLISYKQNGISTSTKVWGYYSIPAENAETPQYEGTSTFRYASSTWPDSVARVNYYGTGDKDINLSFDFSTGFAATSATYRSTYSNGYWFIYRNGSNIGTTTSGTQFNDSVYSLKFTIEASSTAYATSDTYIFTAFRSSNNTNTQKYIEMMQNGGQFNVPASTSLELIGQNDTASTTRITRGGTSGGYTFNATGTVNFQHYRFDYLGGTGGQTGLYLKASSTVISLDYGYFDNLATTTATDTYITIHTNLIGTGTPSKTIIGVTFMKTPTTTDNNVSATGSSATGYWLFQDATGTFAGEAYDKDISAPPGEIQWSVAVTGITISGTVYTDEGTTTMGASRQVRIKVDGAGDYTGNTNGSGVYLITGVVIGAAGNTITAYLDAATTSEKANTITTASTTDTNITGLNLYQNRIIVTHPTSTPLSITNLAQYTNASDTDILFSATSSTGEFTASSTSEFYIWPQKTFNNYGTAGTAGTVTFADFDNNGTFNASATQAINISSNYDNASGTSNFASSTAIFTSIQTGKVLLGNLNATSSFWKVIFNATNSSWTILNPMKVSAPNNNDTFLIKQGTVTLGDGANDDLEILGAMVVGDGSGYATFTTAALNNASGTITININASTTPINCPACIIWVASSTADATSTFELNKNSVLKFNSYSSVQSGLQAESQGYLHIEGEQIATNTVSTVSEDTSSTTITISTSPYTAGQLNGMHLRVMSVASSTTAFGKIYDILDTGINWIKISATTTATSSAATTSIYSISTTTYGVTTICASSTSFIDGNQQQVGRYLRDITGATGYFKIIFSDYNNCSGSRNQFKIIAEPDSDILTTFAVNDVFYITDFINTNDQFEIFDYAQVTANATNHGFIYGKSGSEALIRYADISEMGTNATNKYGIYFYSVNGLVPNSGVIVQKSRIHDGGYNGISFSANANNTIDSNSIYGNTNSGITITNSSANNALTSNNVYNNSTGIYVGSSSRNNNITSNQTYNNTGDSNIFIDTNANNNIISSNSSYGNTSGVAGMRVFDSPSNSFISNNVFGNNATGILFNGGYNTILASNSIYCNGGSAMSIGGTSVNNTITNNTNINNTNYGILFSGDSAYNIITSNNNYGNTTGIGLTDGSNYNILNANNNSNNSSYGVYTSNSDNNIIINENYSTNTTADVRFGDTGNSSSTIRCYNCILNSSTKVSNLTATSSYFVAFNYNQFSTSTQIWGEYSIPADNPETPQNESVNNFSYATNTWQDSIARVNYYGTGDKDINLSFDFSTGFNATSATYRATYGGAVYPYWFIYRNESNIGTTTSGTQFNDSVYSLKFTIEASSTAYATSDTYTFTAFADSNNTSRQKYLTMMQDKDIFTVPAETTLNIQGGGLSTDDITQVSGIGTYWDFYNNSGNEITIQEASVDLIRFSSGTTTVLNTILSNESVTSTAALNTDWYLAVHAVAFDSTSTNIANATCTISEASGSSTVWKYDSGWGAGASSQTATTGANGITAQPNLNGALRIREYQRTADATTTYNYNLTLVALGFNDYNYYTDYGSKYLTSTSSPTGDQTIYEAWQRNAIASVNGTQDYDGLNEAPQHGTWYAGMASDLQFTVSSGAVNMTLGPSNNWTATGTTVLYATTGYAGGYTIRAHMDDTDGRLTVGPYEIARWDAPNATPTAWDGNCEDNLQCGFGYTSSDNILLGGLYSDRFTNNTRCGASAGNYCWAGFATSTAQTDIVADSTSGVSGATTTITYKASVNSIQPADSYTGTIYYICTVNY